MTGSRSVFPIFLLFFGNHVAAGPVLDFLRDYDLNDYSLGIAISASQSPYVGGDASIYPYPYLTSFHDAAFTRDWFLLDEGNVGLRFVTESEWELGLVGRVQTLGLGNNNAAELRGLDDRNWTIEMAPMIAYRGWPVQINAKAWFDTFGTHDGIAGELRLSLPHELERGFIVPSVRAVYRSADYVNHYFGISPAESRPARPEYTAGSSVGTEAMVRWGHQIGANWLLTARLGVEFFDNEITDSPIVEKDRVWSASVGFAYNADIFQPHESRIGGKRQPELEMRLAAFNGSSDAKIILDGADGSPGDEIDLEDVLGVSPDNSLLQIDAIYRFNSFHRLEVGYHELVRRGSASPVRDIRVGDTTFTADSVVATRYQSKLLRVSYAYSLINDAQKELGVMAGVHVTKVSADIVSQTTGERAHSDLSTPLPVIGLHGGVELGAHSTLAARAQLFAMEFDRLEGSMIYLMLEWQRRFGDRFSAGVAYNYYRTSLDSTDADFNGQLRTTLHGPVLFVSANF